ncbi:Ig-like domain-containing protein [Antribacter gilvus]|uniref:Ig-like domain-containing protein n=1 Tax=Antribacter gilvus TaxID=2304675 RepID=UPI000F7796AB|nr:Ig-like domain-containing protein [Antribacter gilvus]
MRRPIAALLVLPALLALVAGCAAGGGQGCQEVTIEVRAVATVSAEDPVPLTATIQADGAPVPGADVAFYVYHESTAGEDEGGAVTANAETDAEGVATVTYTGSADLPAFSDQVVTGYSAALVSSEGTYCRSRSEVASLDVPCAGFACTG